MIQPKEIIRSKRKTIALVIDKEGDLIVRAPVWATRNQIMKFVEAKQDWIAGKMMSAKKQLQDNSPVQVTDGEEIPYMGKKCIIKRKVASKVFFDGQTFMVPDRRDARELLINWYRKQSKIVIWDLVVKHARTMHVAPAGIRITSAKTRWGSCSADFHLNFSYRLLFCPQEVIEYVVVHELCHIWHRDHSKDFWHSVAMYDVQYKTHEKWLKDHSRLMEVL